MHRQNLLGEVIRAKPHLRPHHNSRCLHNGICGKARITGICCGQRKWTVQKSSRSSMLIVKHETGNTHIYYMLLWKSYNPSHSRVIAWIEGRKTDSSNYQQLANANCPTVSHGTEVKIRKEPTLYYRAMIHSSKSTMNHLKLKLLKLPWQSSNFNMIENLQVDLKTHHACKAAYKISDNLN